jgi:iron complex transport system permease protein
VTETVAARTPLARPRGPAPLALCAATGFLLVALCVGLLVGPLDLGVGDVLRSVGAKLHVPGVTSPLTETEETIVWELRVPRVALAALVGGMLALAGATYQGVFRNPLVDPYLLGVAAGAGLGATLAIAYLPRSLDAHQVVPPAAFVGAALAVVASYVLASSAGGDRGPAVLVLAGVTVVSFLTAVQAFIQQQHADTLQEVYSWILGRLPSSGWRDVTLILPYVVVSTVVILAYRRSVDVLVLGDDEARSLGVNVGRMRLVLVAAATVGTAAAVSVVGLIAFVGLIVPHALRLLVGGSYRTLLPLSFVAGAGFLVLVDALARTVLAPAEVPIGVVTAFLGAPFFAVILRTSRRMVG